MLSVEKQEKTGKEVWKLEEDCIKELIKHKGRRRLAI